MLNLGRKRASVLKPNGTLPSHDASTDPLWEQVDAAAIHPHATTLTKEDDSPLNLVLQVGSDNFDVPQDVVRAVRQMLTRVTRGSTLSKKTSVVAALRHEGVSFTALAMATVLANDLEQSVCFVDLNWYWPSSLLNGLQQGSPGIATVLRDGISIEKALVQSNFPNLSLLPSGQVSVAQRPVTARSQALKTLIDDLSQRFDHLILDIPAIAATSDAVPLASLGNNCCLVVRHGSSSTLSVRQALDEIDHIEMLGVVINCVRIQTPKWLLRWIPQD